MDNVQASVTTKMLAETNRARVLQLLYNEKQLTRRAIGDTLNLSAPTVSKIVDKLIEEGLIQDGAMLQSSGGRKPRTLSFVPVSHFAIGVEIALQRVRMVIVDLWGSTQTARNYALAFECSDRYLEELTDLIRNFIQKSRIEAERLLGIAISVCGVVRPNSLTIEYSSTLNVRDWDLSPLQAAFDLPFILMNNAHAAGYMESRNNVRMNKMFYISISEGISGAHLINNDILTGFNNRAGAIGHMMIPGFDRSGARCGTLEEFCSTTVLTGAFNESLDVFFAALKAGEPEHAEIWNLYLNNLATGIGNIRSVVDIAIVLGGALGQYLEDYIDRLLELVERTTPFHEKSVYIRPAYSGSNGAAVGAALQFVNRFLDF